jgi:hypothetical protein
MIVLCGRPGEGLHKYRFAGVAIVDVIITVVSSILISLIFKKNFFVTLAIHFALGICVHAALKIDTAVHKNIKRLFFDS